MNDFNYITLATRKEMKMTQIAFAKMCGISLATLRLIEHGGETSTAVLKKIEKAVGKELF